MEYFKTITWHSLIIGTVSSFLYASVTFAWNFWDAYTWPTVVIFFVLPLGFIIPLSLKTLPVTFYHDIQIAKNVRRQRLTVDQPFRPKLPQ